MPRFIVEVAVKNFLKNARWCSKSRRYAIPQKIGNIGSIASKDRARIFIRAQKKN